MPTMKIDIRNGGLYYGKDWVGPGAADGIAQANGMWCAEQVVKKYEGKTLHVDPVSSKILKVEG